MASLKHPLLRIQRADTHLEDLKRQLDAYQLEFYEVAAKEDAESGILFTLLKLSKAPLSLCGLIVGDAVHNLRACLDNLVWQLSILNPKFPIENPPLNVAFPILKEQNAKYLANCLRFVPAGAIPIIESLQPYQIGQNAKFHPLTILSRLANTDKHSAIQVAALRLIVESPKIVGAKVRILEDGKVLFLVPVASKAQFYDNYNLTAQISVTVSREGCEANIGVIWEIRDYVRDYVLPKFSDFLPAVEPTNTKFTVSYQ